MIPFATQEDCDMFNQRMIDFYLQQYGMVVDRMPQKTSDEMPKWGVDIRCVPKGENQEGHEKVPVSTFYRRKDVQQCTAEEEDDLRKMEENRLRQKNKGQREPETEQEPMDS